MMQAFFSVLHHPLKNDVDFRKGWQHICDNYLEVFAELFAVVFAEEINFLS